MKACFVCQSGENRLDYVYAQGRRERFAELLELCPQVIHANNLEENRDFLRDCVVMLSTWGMVPYTAEQLRDYFPKLRLLLYAAGSVQGFARPFLQSGVQVVSAWGAMCGPVAQFTVSCVVFANKGAFRAGELYRTAGFAAGKEHATERFPGTYGTRVGILGAGMIGSLVIQMLKSYPVELMVYDPFLSDERARELGVRRYGLEELFTECQTITNHIANNKKTAGMLGYPLFSLMKENAAFINTGRGAQVVEEDLVRALREKPNRHAILDVTWPEPVAADHPFWSLPNVTLFPHIAGYAAGEVLGMSDCMLDELRRWQTGEGLRYEVTLPMLETMA